MGSETLVHVIFTGLIVLVPVKVHHDVGELNQYDTYQYTALVPQNLVDSTSADGCPMPEHRAALYIAAGTCMKDGYPCSDSDQHQMLDDKFGAPLRGMHVIASYDLRGWQVSFKDPTFNTLQGPLTPRLQPQKRMSDHEECPLPGEESDSSWIPQTTEQGTVDHRCLAGASTCRLEARIKVPSTDLSTCHLAETADHQALSVFHFIADNGRWWQFLRHQQATADSELVRFLMPDSSLTVHFEQLGGESPFNIVLTPNYLATGDIPGIEIWVADLPEIPPAYDACYDQNTDKHSELYYDLLSRDAITQMPIAMADRAIGRAMSRCTPQTMPKSTCRTLALGASRYGHLQYDHEICGGDTTPPGATKVSN